VRTGFHSRARSGFTLLEMMLAIMILAVVLVMIAGSFNAVIHSKVHGEARLNVDREGRAILWELANEIRGAVQTPNPTSNVLMIGSGQMRDGSPVDAILVSTLAGGHRRAITGLDSEQIVSYSVLPNPQARGWYMLTRSQRSGLLVSSRTFATAPVILADNVISLHIKYFNGGTWLESWDSTQLPPSGGQLPMAVSIDLGLGAGGGRVRSFSTEVSLPMAVQIW
jgi:prepilin-type N-terminal cleavage/methylation domain-containing protein